MSERALAGAVAAGEAFRVEGARLADVTSGLDEATGRARITDAERARLQRLGLRRLSFG